jgi:hypothetical protein
MTSLYAEDGSWDPNAMNTALGITSGVGSPEDLLGPVVSVNPSGWADPNLLIPNVWTVGAGSPMTNMTAQPGPGVPVTTVTNNFWKAAVVLFVIVLLLMRE